MTDMAPSVIRSPGSYLSGLPFSVLASSLKDISWPNMAEGSLVTWSTFRLISYGKSHGIESHCTPS